MARMDRDKFNATLAEIVDAQLPMAKSGDTDAANIVLRALELQARVWGLG